MARSIYVPQAGGLVKFRDEATDADIVAYLKAAYPATPPQPAPQPANDASWYGSAIDSAQGRLQAGLGGVSEAVGLEGLAKYLYDASRANDEEAAKYDWGNTDIWNAPSLWEGAKAAGKSIGQSLPDLAGSMAAAGVGAKVGAAAGTLGGPFAEITVPAGAAIGGIGGALGYYFTSNTGANLQEQVKENGGDLESADEGRAMAGAAIQAPLDVLADKVALKRFFPGVSKEIEKALIGSTITRAAVHGAKSAGVGGVTEALQQAIQIGQANPDKLWSMSPEVQGELIDAAIAGGLFEGIVGGITGGADPAADIGAKRKERELETDIKAEAMAGQEEATNAQVLQAVETLIAKQASGPVQIQFSGTTPDGESATTPKYVVKDAGGNEIVSTTTYPAAVKAISEYKRKTGAKIEVVDDLAASTFKSTPYTVTDKPPAGRAAKWRAEREAAVPFKGGIGDKVVPSTDGVSFTPEFDTPISTPEKTALNEPQVAPIMSKPAMTTSEVDKIFSRENPKNPADPNPPETTPEESAKEDIPSPIVNDMVDENGVPIYTTSFEGQQEGVIAAVPDEAVTNDEISDEPFPAPEPKPVVEKPAPDLTMGEKIIDTPPTRIEITPEERKRQDEQYKAIDTAVKARLNSIGLGSFTGGLNLVPTLPETTSSSAPRGSFTVDKGKPVINLAYGIYDPELTTDQLVKKVVGVLNHEIIHGLRATGFFSPSEWNTLVRAVKTTQYQGKKYTYFDRAKATYAKMADGMPGKEADDYFAEEAVAELYRDWTSDAKAAPKQVRGLMNRILQFFRGVFKGMRAAKYEPVFERTESADKSDLSAVATEAAAKFSAAPDDYIYIIHGGSNFDEINLNKSGTGEPGNIRPLGNGLYGVHVPAGDEEEARVAISLANRYATKYGRGDKTLHVFKVTGDVMHSANGPRSTTLPNYTVPEGRDKAQMRSERLPIGVTEVSVNDPSIAQRVGKYPADTHAQEIISDLQRKDMNGPGGARFSLAPGMEEAALPNGIRGNLFAPYRAEKSVGERIMDLLDRDERPSAVRQFINWWYGGKIKKGDVALANRMKTVDVMAAWERTEKRGNKAGIIPGATGDYDRLSADSSTYVALLNAQDYMRHFINVARYGHSVVKTRDGNFSSAYVAMEKSDDNISNLIGLLMSGPEKDGKPTSLMDVYRHYAVAVRGENLEADGKKVPMDARDRKIALTEIPRMYPNVKLAHEMWQRINKKQMDAAEAAGIISPQTKAAFIKKADYYSFYRTIDDEFFAQPGTVAAGSKINIKAYKGAELGNLEADPITVMLHNMSFWNAMTFKNIASRKAFELGKIMGQARELGATEKPNVMAGEEDQVFHYRVNGVDKRYAVNDFLLAAGLRGMENIDVGALMKVLGGPTDWLRQSVTRDPRFVIMNLLKDSPSAWVLRGENFTPYWDSFKGLISAVRKDDDMMELLSHGVSGQYDVTSAGMGGLSRHLKRDHENVKTSPMSELPKRLWDAMGELSDASDAATRIPVYKSVLKETGNEAEAAFRAKELINFSRRGESKALRLAIQAIPFLNARIQGLDVLYQAGKSATKWMAGMASQTDARIGKAFVMRGLMMAAIAMTIEALQGDDEDYKNLPDYVKDTNLLVKIPGTSTFIPIPKPFEAGLFFMTIPQKFVAIEMGNKTTRDLMKTFTSQIAGTIGVNPVPQIVAPLVENYINLDLYTGQPVVSEGKERLAPFLQYDGRTTALSRMIGDTLGISPAKMENILTGYGGPLGTYLLYAMSVSLNNTLNAAGSGYQIMPTEVSTWPGVRAFMVDAQTKTPQAVADAYEMFREVDTVNRTLSRLRKTGDVEAVRDYVEDNRGILKAKAPVMKIAEALNNIAAQERRIERNTTMTREQKLEAMRKLREMKLRVTQNVPKIREMMDQ